VTGERLKLVTSFDELRAGLLVVVKRCGHCGGEHRGVIVGPKDDADIGRFFEKLPMSQCRPSWVKGIGINAETVRLGMVYLVEDQFEASDAAAATTRKPASVRA
jgi:hypothetical protein